ncbi:hypothetical protein EW026_g7515 [Hermanssonia centrifuga]|uniref:Uncharacterized protein n=1 Tax=Hermanssonia centrifuga TaxID=98765 RepID=A0A4S4K7K3_9APHY|nr:hypothetical protein EW026_g7515 [Hermanssonia centrifuga]
MDNHWQYIYYRIYNEDGALPVKNPVGSDSILGRIIAHSVTPPHNVRNIRHRIAVEEQLPYRYKPDVYLDRDRDGSPAQDVCRVSLSGDSYPGASPESAIGLIISGARR